MKCSTNSVLAEGKTFEPTPKSCYRKKEHKSAEGRKRTMTKGELIAHVAR